MFIRTLKNGKYFINASKRKKSRHQVKNVSCALYFFCLSSLICKVHKSLSRRKVGIYFLNCSWNKSRKVIVNIPMRYFPKITSYVFFFLSYLLWQCSKVDMNVLQLRLIKVPLSSGIVLVLLSATYPEKRKVRSSAGTSSEQSRCFHSLYSTGASVWRGEQRLASGSLPPALSFPPPAHHQKLSLPFLCNRTSSSVILSPSLITDHLRTLYSCPVGHDTHELPLMVEMQQRKARHKLLKNKIFPKCYPHYTDIWA